MQNLEQIRAAAALPAAKKLDRNAVAKLPALIINNGLLATAAFCEADSSGDNRSGMKAALKATADHLKARGIVGNKVKDLPTLIADLSANTTVTLQRATTEALTFIGYLKRFARDKKNQAAAPGENPPAVDII